MARRRGPRAGTLLMSCTAGMSEMNLSVRARSISRSVWEALPTMTAAGAVLSPFERACIIRTQRGNLVTLVEPDLGDGPLNVVLERAPGRWPDLRPGTQVQIQRDRLQLGGLEVYLDGAVVWEPCPDWGRLRTKARILLNRLEQLPAQLEYRGRNDSMLLLVQGLSPAEPSRAGVVHTRARKAADAIWAGWNGDEVRLSAGVARLIGLGGGLTPAGDDFILGVMLCAWLAHPTPSRFCASILEASSSNTTILSRALLESAAAGGCSAPWHRMLEALESGSGDQIGVATSLVLSYGHTSGADALAGFLWAGLRFLHS